MNKCYGINLGSSLDDLGVCQLWQRLKDSGEEVGQFLRTLDKYSMHKIREGYLPYHRSYTLGFISIF